MKISQGIKEVEKATPSVIKILAYAGIGAVLVGVIGGLTITGLPAGVQTFLNTTLGTTGVAILVAILAVLTTVVSLIVISVLWKMFGLGGSKKGDSM